MRMFRGWVLIGHIYFNEKLLREIKYVAQYERQENIDLNLVMLYKNMI